MHTIHFVWAQWLWPPPLSSTSSSSRHVHFALHSFSYHLLRLSIRCALHVANRLCSIIFLKISTQSVPLCSLVSMSVSNQTQKRQSWQATSYKAAHLDTRFQQCLLDSTESDSPNSCSFSLLFYRFALPKFTFKGKIPHSLYDIFLSLYYYCSLTIIASYLLPLLLLLLLLPSSLSPLPPLLLRLLYVHLSQYHNKQTSESTKSTATTRMSDKRIMSWNTYFMYFLSLPLSLSLLFFYPE